MKESLLLVVVCIILFGCEEVSLEDKVINNEIVNIEALDDLVIEYGKNIAIPSKVGVKYSNNVADSVFVKWDSIINPQIPGDYKLTGRIVEDSDNAIKYGDVVSLNIKIKDKQAVATGKWPSVYLFDGYSDHNSYRGSAIESDLMNYYEKDINSLSYFYRIITDNETNKNVISYVRNNHNVNISEGTLNSESIAVLVGYIYRYKYIIGDTLKPIALTEMGEFYSQYKERFKASFGEKYLTEGSLEVCYCAYLTLQPMDYNKSFTSKEIINLYEQFDLQNNKKIDLSDYFVSGEKVSLGRGFNMDYTNGLKEGVSVLDIYNRIQDSVEKSLLDNSLIKDNKLYLINKKYKKYSFLNK